MKNGFILAFFCCIWFLKANFTINAIKLYDIIKIEISLVKR